MTQELPGIVEAVLFASPEPISTEEMVSLLAETGEELFLDERQIEEVVQSLNGQYEEQGRSFFIASIGKGFCFMTRKKYHPWLRLFQHQNEKRRLSQAALEALAIVAYKQPVSKPEVDKIRGVDSGYVIKQLLEKELIRVSGRSDGPGRALLYKTSEIFLKHFGLKDVSNLPKPREIEEIINDADMKQHRQIMLELRQELGEDASKKDE